MVEGGRCRWQDSVPVGACTCWGSSPGKRQQKRMRKRKRTRRRKRGQRPQWRREPGCRWPGCVEGRGAARRWDGKGDGCWTPGHGGSPRGAEEVLWLLGRCPHCSRGHGGAAEEAAGDGGTGQGKGQWGGSQHCPGGGCKGVAPGSRRAARAGRAGCTWGAGWRQRGRWAGGRSARRKHCSWAGAGPGWAGGTGQRSWRAAMMVGRRGSGRGPGRVPSPAPCCGARAGGHSGPAPPSLGSWRRPLHC